MRDSRYLEAVETLARPALEHLQEQRLLEAVPFFYERSAVTREAWERAGVKPSVGSSRVDLQACKLEYSIVSPK